MNIKLFCCDFDGVLTNGKVYFDSNGNILKHYNVKDGYAIKTLKTLDIKTAVISSYKYSNSCQSICEHLGFDFIEINCSDKLKTLQYIVSNLNITLDQVAYIGDDIGDIKVMERVGISACPQDAVLECKNVATYICSNKGGKACVREFIDYILNYEPNNISTNIITKIKKSMMYQLNNMDLDNIMYYVGIIKNFNHNIYFTGLGKSKNMCYHVVDILRSICINAHYLDPVNSVHGDMGPINSQDIVFIYSNSGNSMELLNLASYLKDRGTTIFCITTNKDAKLNSLCQKITVLPSTTELSELLPVPTNSCMCFLLFSNILVVELINSMGLTVDKYKLNHPSGNIGKNVLLTVKDIIITDFPKIVINNEDVIDLHNILLKMTSFKIGCCFFLDSESKLVGILTDGDIRRLLLTNFTSTITINNINKNYYFIYDINERVHMLENIKHYKFIPVIVDGVLIGIADTSFI